MTRKAIIATKNLQVGYGTQTVLSGLELKLYAGELTVLLGPNGSGKSTLIRSISGVQKSLEGQTTLKDKPIENYGQKAIAKEVGLVLTENQTPGNLTVFALVALGRFPYTSWLGKLTSADEKRIIWALEVVGILEMANRLVGELSDGERQKVMIARVLAQETGVMILDEPTAHLDSPNRIEIFSLLRELTNNTQKAILISTHDIETALSYADRLWLVKGGKIESGVPEDLVLSGHLEKAFQSGDIHFDYERGTFQKQSEREMRPVQLIGDQMLKHWVGLALERNGFQQDDKASLKITVQGTRQAPLLKIDGRAQSLNTIEELLNELSIEDT